MLIELINPIPNIIRDPSDLGDFFDKYSIIPYYGTAEGTSHSMLNLLADLSVLSPSHQSCKNDIITYAFSSRVDIVPRSIPGLIDDDIELTREQKIQFNDNFLQPLGLNLPTLVKVTRTAFEHLADSGNAYIRIQIVRVGGVTQVYFKNLHYKHCAYLRTKQTEERVLVYTKKWGDEDYWAKNKPQVYPASFLGRSFNWKGGTTKQETVLHLKKKSDESDYYGRPNILSVLYWMFVEWTQSDLAVKTGSTEFVSKMLLAFEEIDPARKKKGSATESDETAFRRRMTTIRSLTTNEGTVEDAKTLAGIEYPYGGKPPIAIPLNINRDVKFSEHQIDKASSYIYSVHGWDKQLTGFEPARSNIGGNIVIDLFTVKNIGTIQPLQNDWREIWSAVLNEIAVQTNYKGEVFTVRFPNLIDGLVEQLIASKSGKTKDILQAEENTAVDSTPDIEVTQDQNN